MSYVERRPPALGSELTMLWALEAPVNLKQTAALKSAARKERMQECLRHVC
jgi:hypothetical protein